jgi:hypothetical protein
MADDNFDFDKIVDAVTQRVQADAKAKGNGTDPDPDLVEMNDKYTVIQIGGKARVVWFEDSPVFRGSCIPVFSTFKDFREFLDRRKKAVVRGDKLEQVGIGTWWLKHDGRAQRGGIVYAPGQETPDKINLWQGFSCKPSEGECGMFLDHLHNVVCGGNAETFEYALNFMAHNVQYPGCPGEVALVLRGPEGAGKGTIIRQLGQLFGVHYLHVWQAKHLTGHFNSHLQHCSCLYADEAFYAGDRQHESTLKALITEPTLMIEPKGLEAYPMRNCIHLYMTSNSEWVVPAGAMARRFLVLDVASGKIRDFGYFTRFAEEMDGGGREALLDLLLNRDISKFNIRDVPLTKGLADQKRYSRRGVDQLIEIIAHDGDLPCAHSSLANVAVTGGEGDGRGFYAAAKKMVPDLRYLSSSAISQALRETWGCARWRSAQQRGIEFPPLKELRAKFDRHHGPQEWGEPDSWQLPENGVTHADTF